MDLGRHSQLMLRLGLAFVFGVFGIDKLVHWPLGVDWTGWIPGWLTLVPATQFLYVLGALEVIVAILLLIGRYVRFAALACALFLAGIVVTFGFNEIMIRDIGLIAMALALAMLPEHRQYHEIHQLVRRLKR